MVLLGRIAAQLVAAIAFVAAVQKPTDSLPSPVECKLQASELESLVRLGTKGSQQGFKEPEPVKLRIGGLRKWTVGSVYPPALRVRIAARAAQLAYKPFGSVDVGQEICQNITLVSGTPWVGHSVTTIVLLPKGSKEPHDAVQPLWTRTFDVVAPAIFGSVWFSLGHGVLGQAFQISEEETLHGLVAAFDPQAITLGREVVIVYDGRFNKQGFGRTNENRFSIEDDWK